MARVLAPQKRLGLVGVTRHVNGESRHGREQRDVTGSLVRAAFLRGVVRRTDADQHRADVLVAEVELDLLERALDEKRRVAVDDRAQAFLCQSGGDSDHQLLADADVEDALGVPFDRTGPLEGVDPDVGQHERQARIAVEGLGRHAREALPHGRRTHASTSAITACGRPGSPAAMACSSAPWSRACALALVQPSPVKRSAMPSGQP